MNCVLLLMAPLLPLFDCVCALESGPARTDLLSHVDYCNTVSHTYLLAMLRSVGEYPKVIEASAHHISEQSLVRRILRYAVLLGVLHLYIARPDEVLWPRRYRAGRQAAV
jgi:hypothetical protein